ncbi:hypothetical protein FG386_002003 [Cryptosporidium ryanae]|uniref:uncharacterized protein n=1 Tax=Cryptosporidium ryanae TaxID=515981 RepID=UPI00351A40AC|nr:hypothetical protein FG386_002003 [Cryptosporidium ryanae]
MDEILVEFQEGKIGRQDALMKLGSFVDLNGFGNKLLINTVALLIRNYSFVEKNVQKVLGLLLELGVSRDLETKKRVCYVSDYPLKNELNGEIIKTLVRDILLEGVSVRDFEVRLNSLVCLNILLKLLSLNDYYGRLMGEDELYRSRICNSMLQIVHKEKSVVAKKMAISNLGLISGGNVHLLDLLKSENYVLRMRSLESIQILDLDDREIMILFSRILDENYRVRRTFYRYLCKNSIYLRNLVLERMLWPHFVLLCQFGLNDRSDVVKRSCLDFLIDFISGNYGSGSFDGDSFISFLDDMIGSIYTENKREATEREDSDIEERGDLTASNVEAVVEISLPGLLNHSKYDLDVFMKQITTQSGEHSGRHNNNNESIDPEIILNLKTSQILALRVLVENYSDRILESGKYEYISIENVIISISKNSNNSFIIRQMLLILACLDKSDPEVMKVVETLSVNCIKYTPIDDSLELLESELMPPESMVRSPNGGEWVAYFLNRSVIRASMDSLRSCMVKDVNVFATRIRDVVEEILNPINEEEVSNDTHTFIVDIDKRGINELSGLLEELYSEKKSDYAEIRENLEMRWMRVLLVVESFLSLTREINHIEADYITNDILKPCTNFFFKYSGDHEIPQILLARCTALVTIVREKCILSGDLGVVVDSEDDNLWIFIKGLENALLNLNSEGYSSNTIYISVLCEVYVSAIVDILIIRQMKNGGNINFNDGITNGLSKVWRLANCSFNSTHRLSSIAMRGVSRVLLCLNLKTRENQSVSIEMLTCLLFLVYFSGTSDEFEVLLEPQGEISASREKQREAENNAYNNIFSIDYLINCKENNLRISSGDKQILLYLFSTYITLGFEHIKCFTVSIYRLMETLIKNVGITRWSSGLSKSVNKLLLFGTIQVKQAFLNVSLEDKSKKLYSNVYGILFLYCIFEKYPKHSRKIDFTPTVTKLFLDIDLETKLMDSKGTDFYDNANMLRKSFVYILRKIKCGSKASLEDRERSHVSQSEFKECLKSVKEGYFMCTDEKCVYLRELVTDIENSIAADEGNSEAEVSREEDRQGEMGGKTGTGTGAGVEKRSRTRTKTRVGTGSRSKERVGTNTGTRVKGRGMGKSGTEADSDSIRSSIENKNTENYC